LPTYKKINIALVFVGEHALRNIIPVLLASPYYKMIGLYFRTQNPKLINKFRMYKIYREYSEVLDDKNVDCIYISSPNIDHFKHSYLALKSYKHVICEKPLTTNYENISELIKLSLIVEKCIFEGFMFQYHQQFVELQNLMNSKNPEKLLTLVSRFGYPHLKKENIRYQKNLDGGAFFDCACYLIKATYLILGDNYKNIEGCISYDDDYEVDTGGVCLINYKSGPAVFLDWGMGRSYTNEIDIWTEKHRIKANRFFSKSHDLESTIIKVNSTGDINSIEIQKMNHFEAMFNEFYKVINGNQFDEHLIMLKSYQRFFFSIYDSLFAKKV